MRGFSTCLAVTVFGLAGGLAGGLVQPVAAEVTLEKIMSDPDWIGNGPENPHWGEFSRSVYFERKREGDEIREQWAVGIDGSGLRRVPPRDLSTFARPGGDYNQDFSQHVYEHGGDLYVVATATGKVRQLTQTGEHESSPEFLLSDSRIQFERGGRTLVLDLESGLVSEPAELRVEDDPAEEKPAFDYLESKQLRLYRELAEEKANEEKARDHERQLQRDDPKRAALPWYLGEDTEVVRKALSPDAGWLLVVTREKSEDRGRKGQMPNYVTRSGYLETDELRTRVGQDAPKGQKLLLLNLADHEMHEIDLSTLPGVAEDPLAELRKSAIEWHVEKGADRDLTEKALEAPETRAVLISNIIWSDDGWSVAVQAHSVDNKDRWLFTIDPDRPKIAMQHRLTDPAWINWRYNEFGWLPDGETIWYLSEESGYSHLYLKSATEKTRQMTRGAFEVSNPMPNRDGSRIYYRANQKHPGEYEIYRLAVEDGSIEALTELGGVSDFRISPDEEWLVVTHSTINRPPDLWVQEAKAGAEARQLTFTVSTEFKRIEWVVPEIVEVPSSHVERPIYSKLYKPADFDPEKSYPAVVFVHGAGYLQNSHKGWAGYFREFMFHTLLVEHGYLVLDMDYRASAGYGRDWRTAIYRQMGHPELEDLQDGVSWLVANQSVDPGKVGVYGGSYGGFMTFMALFRDPELFAAGAALRPVTDWAHYNHGYTSNILNTPEIDPVAFEISSPIEYAQNLERPLLIASGMQDNNVFFQDTVLLVQRLIELKKQDFETAFYPLDPHGFVHPESWLDEYRRIFKLFERHVGGDSCP